MRMQTLSQKMAERSPTKLWIMRLAYLGFAALILFAHLLPLETTPQRFAGPDILVALTFAWALRRPQYVPMLLVALVLFLADLLLQRPPGLWAALILLSTEWLKSRDRSLRENTFVAEWVTVGSTLFLATLLYRLILGLLIVSPGALSLSFMQYGMTMLAYPLIAGASYLAFGTQRGKQGEVDHVGRRI